MSICSYSEGSKTKLVWFGSQSFENLTFGQPSLFYIKWSRLAKFWPPFCFFRYQMVPNVRNQNQSKSECQNILIFNGIPNHILSHQNSDELGFRFSDYDCAVRHPPGTQCQRQPEDFRPRAEHNRTCPGSGRSSPIFRPSCSDRSEAWQEWIWRSPGGLDRGLGALLRPRLVEREGEWHLVEKKLILKIEHWQSNLGIKIRSLGPSAETRVPKY